MKTIIKFKTQKALTILKEQEAYETKERQAYKSMNLFRKMALKKLNPALYQYLKDTSSEFTQDTHVIKQDKNLTQQEKSNFIFNFTQDLEKQNLFYGVDYSIIFEEE
jgi:hypothetical protein